MGKIIKTVTKLQKGPYLKLIFSLKHGTSCDGEVSELFNINDFAEVRFKFDTQSAETVYSLSWKKHESAVDYTVNLNVTCEKLYYSKHCICTEHFTDWIRMGHHSTMATTQPFQKTIFSAVPVNNIVSEDVTAFEVNLSVSKLETITFAKLYQDEEFCDFHLKTVDDTASVPVHKACLIAHSDMFKTMLNGEWKETINGCIEIKEVTLQTLKHLKEYIYLGTLPNDSLQLQPLLLLAKCYMIENLKTECVMKLAETVKPEHLYSLQEFAVDNKIPELVRAMLQFTPDGTVHSAHKLEDNKDLESPAAKKKKTDEENKT